MYKMLNNVKTNYFKLSNTLSNKLPPVVNDRTYAERTPGTSEDMLKIATRNNKKQQQGIIVKQQPRLGFQ